MIWEAAPTGKRGRQPDYSDAAIQICLTMKVLFGMALRQMTGFVESLLRLIDLDWAVPNFSTLSRRQKTLQVNIPYRGSQGPLHLLIGSTGIKVEGERKWNARKHGGTKRRVWRKIHIGIDEKTLEIRAAEFTTSDVGDAPMLPELLDQIPPDQEIASVTADGAFDIRKCHDAIAAHGAAATPSPAFQTTRSPKSTTCCRGAGTDARARDAEFDRFFAELLTALGLDAAALPGWWQGGPPRLHVQRWREKLGLSADEIVAVALATRGEHPEPPDGPKALDRAMQRAVQRKTQGKAEKHRKAKTEPVKPATIIDLAV